MRAALLLFLTVWAASAADVIEAWGHKWTLPDAAEWKLEGNPPVLKLLVAKPSLKPRRPSQYALTDVPPYQRITVEAEVKRNEGSLIIVYAWRDADHFNYVHLSKDEASAQPVHNGVFHVYGGDRVRISPEKGPASLPTTDWYKVRLTHDAHMGIVSVAVNGASSPSLEAADYSLGAGKIGLGSFFETAQFRNVKITVTN